MALAASSGERLVVHARNPLPAILPLSMISARLDDNTRAGRDEIEGSMLNPRGTIVLSDEFIDSETGEYCRFSGSSVRYQGVLQCAGFQKAVSIGLEEAVFHASGMLPCSQSILIH